jgi:hypothetical protein
MRIVSVVYYYCVYCQLSSAGLILAKNGLSICFGASKDVIESATPAR